LVWREGLYFSWAQKTKINIGIKLIKRFGVYLCDGPFVDGLKAWLVIG
jgi:hypothetical protein